MVARLIAVIRSGQIDARTLVTYRNVVESAIVKGLGVVISLIAVPLTIRYVSISEFGIWMTITSLASWFSLVDVSFGNGLRNSLVSFFSSGDQRTARQYVSTIYMLSGVVALGLLFVVMCINYHASWSDILHIETNDPALINMVVTYTLAGFIIQLFLKPINAILLADQRAAYVGWIMLAINALTLFCLYGAMKLASPSLLTMAYIYTLAPISVFGVISAYLFSRTYAGIAPRLADVRRSLTRELFSTGGQFFVLQLISVLVFTSGGLFISYFQGSGRVGPYSIVSKYFGVVTMLYGIVITPYWSAFTDAYSRQDKTWIARTMTQLNQVGGLMVLLIITLLVLAHPILQLWVGTQIAISTEILVWMSLYSVSYIFLSNYNCFVNGVGKIRRLVLVSTIGTGVYIGLMAFLFRYLELGPVSVIIAGTAWNLTLLLVCRADYRKLINEMPA